MSRGGQQNSKLVARAVSAIAVVKSKPEKTEDSEHRLWKFHLRPPDDDAPQTWWFASTASPMLAATTGPLANVLSIAALVTSWRCTLPDNGLGKDSDAVGFADPRWCIVLNAISLVCGFVGNGFLLLNFTQRVRYIIALPLTIILWYLATAILIGITVSMEIYVPPNRPQETYSQGFWYAIIAAVIYLLGSMILMINMLGYFLGHYPQHFDLADHQRTLILQTMMFFFWLAGGAGIFARVAGFSYVDALYFCDVTILTVGFGDLVTGNDVGRGLVFPFSVGGIVMLGLVVGSINRFAGEIGRDKVVKNQLERNRVRTVGRSVTRSMDLPERQIIHHERPMPEPITDNPQRHQNSIKIKDGEHHSKSRGGEHDKTYTQSRHVMRRLTNSSLVRPRKPKVILLREEKDRFDAMREIQRKTSQFKKWYRLGVSVTAFGLLWCVGAVGFWVAEDRLQSLSYFESLYFCYVSLLTIGYGDLSPRSNAGKPFFVVWSLLAVPTMTILISNMSDTVIASFKRGTFALADWTVLPKAGVYHAFLKKTHLLEWFQKRAEKKAAEKRIEEGFTVEEAPPPDLTVEQLAEGEPTHNELGRRLALAIHRTANDLSDDPPRRYTYEEWAEFTRLIRFTSESRKQQSQEESEEGLIEWDWIGADSPMLANQTEASWVLDRLTESLGRFLGKMVRVEDGSGGRKNKRRRKGKPPTKADQERRRMQRLDDDDEEMIRDDESDRWSGFGALSEGDLSGFESENLMGRPESGAVNESRDSGKGKTSSSSGSPASSKANGDAGNGGNESVPATERRDGETDVEGKKDL